MFFRGSRRRPHPRRVVDPTAPDEMFPHLPRHRADFLREQTMRLLHEDGYDTSWRPDGYIAARHVPEGSAQESIRLISLDTLSLQIADAGRRANLSELLELIRNHIHGVTNGQDPADIRHADFLRQLRVRLASTETLEAMSGTVADASREFTGDLHASLVLDTPDTVTVLDDATLAAQGTATPDELSDLYRVGYRNTWQALAEARVTANPVQGDEVAARFWVIESDSFFLASAPLFLGELLPRWTPALDTTHGVIVAVPHRHLMMLREVSTGQDLLDGINTMSAVALGQHRDNAGPLSARLHLLCDGEFRAFTDISTDDEGRQVIEIHPDSYLMSRMEGAGGEG